MADEPSEAPASQDTPETPVEDTSQEVDWRQRAELAEKRYEDHRSAFDRRDQKWSRYDENPEQFLIDHGYEVEGDEPEQDEYVEPLDPYEELQQKVQALEADREAEMQQARQEALEEAEIDYINSQWDQVLDSNREYTDEEIDLLGDVSRLRRTEDGRPDVKAAHDEIYGTILSREKERWVDTKRAPSVQAGQQGGESLDLDDPKERHDYMAKRLAEIDAEQ